MMSSWAAYPKIYALGHPNIADLLGGAVVVEEKVDGSQFSFGMVEGKLRVRSKGKEMELEAPEKMFGPAVKAVMELAPRLTPEWTYVCEFLSKPKHNTLAYDRAPMRGLVLLDVRTGTETYLMPGAKYDEARRLGIDCAPYLGVFGENHPLDEAALRQLLEAQSFLGGQKIEGVVIKRYDAFGPDGKALMGKYVSEAFKEVHRGDWKERNPGPTDVVAKIVHVYRTPARWEKAVQHLEEVGKLEHSPRDIGLLLPAVSDDTLNECGQEIVDELWGWAWPKIRRGITAGFAEWYKERLMRSQFGGKLNEAQQLLQSHQKDIDQAQSSNQH